MPGSEDGRPAVGALVTGPPNAVDAPKTRILWLDVARGCSILLVVLLHGTIIIQAHGTLSREYWVINDLFAAIRMPLFFTISGILGTKLVKADWYDLLKKRVWFLWYLYLLWATVAFIADHSFGVVSFGKWAGLAIWPNPVLWYIWALGFYFVVARFAKGRAQRPTLAVALVLSLLIESHVIDPSYPEYFKALSYAPFFLIGTWYGPSLFRLLDWPRRTLSISLVVFIPLFFALRWGWAPVGLRWPLGMAGLAAGLSGSILLSSIPLLGMMLAYFGRNTLTIYVSHALFLKVLFMFMASAGLVALPGFSLWGALILGALAISSALLLRPLVETVGGRWLYSMPTELIDRLRFAQLPSRSPTRT